ncbi:4'-phosphopantetheinyl transferase [Kaistia sp. 32K]|uniref:4'-phosphopantetheinyl transferase family protein n=1 Tax=Kaistia sp. 32K TaxID=2795690 RepID=UPI0019165B3B|nr:4'-phosphopantetheinyl transferase superfamily protein [Kaistia sp. 32K]BCP52259.1 4'-phosphopantetheinyl transferase [Kaistia sp. 32K]
MSCIFEVEERALDEALRAIVPEGVWIGCRRIRPGDEDRLTPIERLTLGARPMIRQRASGAARQIARDLFRRLDHANADIVGEPSGAPRWPEGLIGSLAHDDEFAVAVVARRGALANLGLASLGVDVEPAEPLPPEVEELIRAEGDQLAGIDPALATRMLFSAKEAVYKAVFPLDGVILNHDDIAVDLRSGLAITTNGRRVRLSCLPRPRVVTLAWC